MFETPPVTLCVQAEIEEIHKALRVAKAGQDCEGEEGEEEEEVQEGEAEGEGEGKQKTGLDPNEGPGVGGATGVQGGTEEDVEMEDVQQGVASGGLLGEGGSRRKRLCRLKLGQRIDQSYA
jgi:hypothetical protein